MSIPKRPHNIASEITDSVLRVLRDQRDDKHEIEAHGLYEINPQMFTSTNHFVTPKIEFTAPFQTKPNIIFGQYGEEISERVSTIKHVGTGYTPMVFHVYVYKFSHNAGAFDGFHIGLHTLSKVPHTLSKHTISWRAKGKGSAYPRQKVDDSWTSSYNRTFASYLVHETGEIDEQ